MSPSAAAGVLIFWLMRSSQGWTTSVGTSTWRCSTRNQCILSSLEYNADAVEFTGKNDLFVTIMLSELNIRTTTQNDIGANAIWKLTEDNACKLSNEELGTATMRVEVWDENTMRKNTLIGTAPNVSISKLVGAVPGVDVQVSFDVLNGKGKKSGSVVVTMRMSN
jgi:hypothetical protein